MNIELELKKEMGSENNRIRCIHLWKWQTNNTFLLLKDMESTHKNVWISTWSCISTFSKAFANITINKNKFLLTKRLLAFFQFYVIFFFYSPDFTPLPVHPDCSSYILALLLLLLKLMSCMNSIKWPTNTDHHKFILLPLL